MKQLFVPQRHRSKRVQQDVPNLLLVPRRVRDPNVQHEELEFEHEGPGPLQLLPAVSVSQACEKENGHPEGPPEPKPRRVKPRVPDASARAGEKSREASLNRCKPAPCRLNSNWPDSLPLVRAGETQPQWGSEELRIAHFQNRHLQSLTPQRLSTGHSQAITVAHRHEGTR